jgi:uncharacterized protein (TIGR03000 family)
LATLLVSMNLSSAQTGPGQLGPLWQRTGSGVGTYYRSTTAPQTAVTTPAESQSFYSGTLDDLAVLLRLQVPMDAKVWIDGTATTSTGEFRSYISPPLTAGQNYTYQIRVQSGAGEQTRSVTVRSGDRVNLDFRIAANQ